MVNAGLSLVELNVFPSSPMELSLYARNLADDGRAADPGFASVDYPLARRSYVLELRQKF
jgi:hypothetical protein